ncbi:CAMK family protein kinase [Histomonas meleagridis]|uniref:CAMK family protein kinase n=1 Tax=Histomonas meleagridis TaxID=135588 RepID=UPI003559CDA7|nr:CAMK family protein kinase [Histomonas meleagridis]KAH0806074.1 CAMK family protein kinase [Histomonas meleagridis]
MDDEHQENILNEARKALYQHGYDSLQPIGNGGFASIYKIMSIQCMEEFAVKIIDISAEESPILPDSFQAEIHALTTMNHPNIIKIYDYFTSKRCLYIVLEYCHHGSLSDFIKEKSIGAPRLYQYCQEIILAIEACHSYGLAHRDIKPSNILVDKHGRVKLADFGLSIHFPKIRSSKFVACSLPYTAPEVLRHKATDPFKTDIWSLGVTFFEMSTGELPFIANTVSGMIHEIDSTVIKSIPSVSFEFNSKLQRMLCVDPKHRISIRELRLSPVFQIKLKSGIMTQKSVNNLNPREPLLPMTKGFLSQTRNHFGRKRSVANMSKLVAHRTFHEEESFHGISGMSVWEYAYL